MVPFTAEKQLVLACHLTGIYDVNRNNTLADDDYSLVQDWAASLAAQGLKGVLFHNNFTAATCAAHQNKFISFVKVAYDPRFKPNVFRYLVYRDFVRAHAQTLESLFVTDVSDVVAICNPFVQPLFVAHTDMLFCGDEPKRLDNEWMRAHATHLRSKIAGYAAYEAQFGTSTLLNCGIIGGHIGIMQELIEKLAFIHETYNYDNQTAYTGDMGAFNYVVRTAFKDRLLHGAPINTVFKAYQQERTDCWFRHK